MTLRESQIIRTALTKIFPFALLYSMYVFSYGGAFPGGGFQAGVIIGSLVVIVEMVLERKLYSDAAFQRIELFGVLLLVILLLLGLVRSGQPFTGLYIHKGESLPLANIMIWLLSAGIFLEVAGSMVLIFRSFLFWESEDELYIINPGSSLLSDKPPKASSGGEQRKIRIITGILIAAAFIYLLITPSELSGVLQSRAEEVHSTAEAFGIRNMVTVVYLGPRVMDTFLEVMVVVLTVFGVKAVRGRV